MHLHATCSKTRMTRCYLGREALPGEVLEGETTEDIKESSNRRRWVAFVWMLTWYIPNIALVWCGRMKRLDVRQAWRGKAGAEHHYLVYLWLRHFHHRRSWDLICPTEHVFSVTELASHSAKNNPNNIFTAIRGEVFDLTNFIPFHQRIVSVVSSKSMQQYGGLDASNIFPVQVRYIVHVRYLLY